MEIRKGTARELDELAALYNAPVTMDSYYTSLVSHDLYGSGDRR